MRNFRFHYFAVLWLLILTAVCGSGLQAQETVRLATGGRALQPLIVSVAATARTQAAAKELAAYLGRISGAEFTVQEGVDVAAGIVVGVYTDFPELPAGKVDFAPEQHDRREDYSLRSHAAGLLVLGATELAVEHAVWDLLYRLGYRQFFPGQNWEIVPEITELSIGIDNFQRPDFHSRSMPSATSRGAEAFGDREALQAWAARNRLGSGWRPSSSHVYQAIHRDLAAEFERHPEYLGLVNGKRTSTKFCISNPGLRQLIVNYALDYFRKNPERESISMEPSDGGSWCECDGCAAMGGISNRTVTLANEVAAAVNQLGLGTKYVGLLAYNYHCAPPAMPVHPQVAITICMGQLTGGWKPLDLFAAWSERGGNAAGFGVFEYYSNIVKNRYLPGRLRIANIDYLRRTIPEFHRFGGRRLNSGVAYSNGTVSLGAYFVSRLLWDVTAAERIDELYQDFLDKAFGAAAAAMDAYFRQVYRFDDQQPRLPLTEDTVGKMYRSLAQALPLAETPAVRRRIQDMILYTRYVELTLGDDYGDVLRHVWRTRKLMLVNTYGLFTYPPAGSWRTGQLWQMPAAENPYKEAQQAPAKPKNAKLPGPVLSGTDAAEAENLALELDDLFEKKKPAGAENPQTRPYNDAEIAEILDTGIKNNRIGLFQTKEFSMDLVPAAVPLKLPEQALGHNNLGLSVQGPREFYTWLEDAPGEVKLRIAGGFMWPARAGNVQVRLYWLNPDTEDDILVAEDESIPPDQQEHVLVLRSPHRGLHRIEVENGAGATTVVPAAEGMPFTVLAGPEQCFKRRHIWEGWFYVPKGTESISFHVSTPSGDIYDGANNLVLSFSRIYRNAEGVLQDPPTVGGYYTVKVPPGQDGAVWKLYRVKGPWLFLNLPPSIARRPAELLLPREVVEKDSGLK